MVKRRSSWRSTLAFYLLSVGSALGLGNLWRLPFVMGENGGGAFFLFYLLFAFLIGLPLLIAELMLGQKLGESALKASLDVSKKVDRPLFIFGALSVLLSTIVLSYYSVISGWVLHFLARFVIDLFVSDPTVFSFTVLQSHPWLQILLTSVHLLFVILIVSIGVQEGLEKWIRTIVPAFFLLVAVLLWKSLSQGDNAEIFRFLFYPDFSKVTWETMSRSLAHVFFTMSVGFGLMVSFGSYLKSDDHIPTLGFRIAMIDVFVSIVALLFVFPVAFQATQSVQSDPILLFNVIPQYFHSLGGGGAFLGLIFFLCLYLASLNASLALTEALISNLQSVRPKMSRNVSVWSCSFVILWLTVFWVLTPGIGLHSGGPKVLEVLDNLAVNWLLPIVALGLLITFNYAVSDKEKSELFVDRSKFISVIMESHWFFVIRWLAPVMIGLALFLQLISFLFKNG
jgi:NSS family neurotransmitter:Na+ symporter